MSMDSFGTLAPKKPTKFVNVAAGSVVEFTDPQGEFDPFQATVLEMIPEFGANAVPALVYRVEGDSSPQILPDSGRWRVRVLVNAAVVQRDPAGITILMPKPNPTHGVQFTGGIDNASEIVRWATGKTVISWHQAVGGDSEHLTVHTKEGQLRVEIGWWILQDTKGLFHPGDPDVVQAKYDIV